MQATAERESRKDNDELPGKSPHSGSVLDVGCGAHKVDCAIGIDQIPASGVDVVYDLNSVPWPFAANTFKKAICRHSLAHLENVVRTMEELHRILQPEGILEILTPHFSSDNAFTDVTSHWFFGSRSMDYFCINRPMKHRYGQAAFELLETRISFYKAVDFESSKAKVGPFRALGIEALVNRFPRVYEHFFAFIFRANEVYYRLRVVK